MGRLITDTFNFAAITEPEWPAPGSFIVGFDSADNQLKKLDSFGVLTPIGGGNLSDTLDTGNDVNASGIINTFSSQAAIDVNTRLLIGTGSLNSIDWESRQLMDSTGTITVDYNVGWLVDPINGWANLQWIAGTLNDPATSSTSLNWATRQAYATDGTTVKIDWDLGRMYNSAGGIKVDWQLGILYNAPVSNLPSINWSSRNLITGDGLTSVLNWSALEMYDLTGTRAMYWGGGSRALFDSLGDESINFGGYLLSADGGINVVQWGGVNKRMWDSSSVLSLNWEIRTLYDSAGITPSIDWADRNLHSAAGLITVDWSGAGILYDTLGSQSIIWGNRVLRDTSENTVLDWDAKTLRDTTSATVLDWENSQLLGNWYIDNNFGIGTSTFNASMTNGLSFLNSTAPSNNVTDQFALYSFDVTAGNAAPHFRTEAGHIVKLYTQAADTGALTTMTANDPGIFDFAIQDLTAGGFGFVTSDEAQTLVKVIINLQTRLAELEAKLTNLGILAPGA